jgi:hypothetical protein
MIQLIIIYIFYLKAKSSIVKTLISLGCCISFSDESKETVLYSKTGLTALYWIIMNTPENVSYFIVSKHKEYLNLKHRHMKP